MTGRKDWIGLKNRIGLKKMQWIKEWIIMYMRRGYARGLTGTHTGFSDKGGVVDIVVAGRRRGGEKGV